MIDNNMDRLAAALGHFGAGVSAHLNDPLQKKAQKDAQLAEWEKWTAARTSTQQLDAIRTGKAPYWSDPFIKEIVRRDYAGLEAQTLADELDNGLKNGEEPKFGTPSFDPDAFVVSKAAPYMQRVGRDPSSTVAFGGALDKIREGYKRRHEEALGIAQTGRIEDMARSQIDDAVTTAIEGGLNGQQITDGLRKVYSDLGPRAKGGSLDLKYARLDDLLIDVIEKKVKDPRYARQALQVLTSERVGLDGENRVGALSSVARNSDKVEAIKAAALKTLGDEWENQLKVGTANADLQRLKLNDGSFAAQVRDAELTNGVDSSKTVKLSGENRKKTAIEAFIAETRATNNPQQAFDIEFDTVLKNGVEHPEWVPFLKSTFTGLANTNVSKGVGPDQIERIQQAAQIYNKIGDRNWNYLNQFLSKDARDFYELHSTLTRYVGANSAEAAQATALAFSSEQANQDPKVLAGRLEEVRSKASRMDMSWLPFSGTVSNGGEIQNHITDIAGALMRTGGVDVDTAIKAATDRIKNNSAYINGRAIMSPGLLPGDAPHVEAILDQAFKGNEVRLKSLGIDSSSELSVAPLRNGAFVVIQRNAGAVQNGTGFVTVQTPGPDGKPGAIRPLIISTAQIAQMRQATETKAKKEAADAFAKDNEIKRSINPYEPHNLIRKIFGSGPSN